ncbi:hypothetical protein H6F32_05095 [Anabaena sp. FACHB-1237]|uniref:hypothetical protein n=1 Tax=Anabaena sp. FACHB-1237 TaxID=2692769 RepID=UPI001680B2D1|nr:hypothetical protein [Anabaena sp. FACHB-1237]MBD2136975.1 hypothetical protein [Anabaena sp. FACHB-1237]
MGSEERFALTNLPLAVYRELEVHLLQVSGVEVGLIPQTSSDFDYTQSQVSGLWIRWKSDVDTESRDRVKQILAYYQNRYGI